MQTLLASVHTSFCSHRTPPSTQQRLLRQALASRREPLIQSAMYATEYEILRSATSTLDQPCAAQPRSQPHRLAILINEAQFVQEPVLLHGETVWLEDRIQDWDYRNDLLYYYGHAIAPGAVADLVAIYQVEYRTRALSNHA